MRYLEVNLNSELFSLLCSSCAARRTYVLASQESKMPPSPLIRVSSCISVCLTNLYVHSLRGTVL